MPDDQARHLITTFGILGSSCAGIGGAVLTLRGHPGLDLLPLAELGLGFFASVLIAACGIIAGKQQEKRDLPGEQGAGFRLESGFSGGALNPDSGRSSQHAG